MPNPLIKIKPSYAKNNSNDIFEVNDEGVNFLPFLDILFSTMGIFLIIIFLHEYLSNIPEPNTQKIDVLIVCLPNDKYEWFGADYDESVELGISEVKENLTTLAKKLKSNPHILAAFTKEGIESRKSLKELFDNLSKDTDTSPKGVERMTVQPFWWPLNYSDNSYSALIEQWNSSLKEKKNENQRNK
ncbi:hypothetical protein [Candidatus Parabeggiatoa sp. HSG14]|uniref:hypothetical protein n=1 Tax=Candidatus Parabeggiatoa sp. HSG14 TaxID=3055593 RepID=UPI0025A6C2BA|nr:hypothetical protein [Thiotrichales bacterium HSG14]